MYGIIYLTTVLQAQPTLILLVIFVSALLLLQKQKKINLPPGPISLPFIGTPELVQLKKIPQRHLWNHRMAKQYGDVVYFRNGITNFVLLNDVKLVKDCFLVSDGFIDRPATPVITSLFDNHGVLFSNGSKWKEQRRFTIKTFREFGMGKSILVEHIHAATDRFMKHIDQNEDKSFNPAKLINQIPCTIVGGIIFGEYFDIEDSETLEFIDTVDEWFRVMMTCSSMDNFPILKWLPGLPEDFSFTKLRDLEQKKRVYCLRGIKWHEESLSRDNVRDFVDEFLLTRSRDSANTSFTDAQLVQTVCDMFSAGIDTTSQGIRWSLYYMSVFPHIQERVSEEIEKFVGTEVRPDMSHQSKLVYTEATMCEVLRYCSLASISLGHLKGGDSKIVGYDLPKDTIVLSNILSIHHSTKYWDKPEEFNPERFIDPNGKLLKPEAFIPFGLGKRSCLGETLAKMELFLVFSAIIQRYRVSLPDADRSKVNLHGTFHVVTRPPDHKLIFNKRV